MAEIQKENRLKGNGDIAIAKTIAMCSRTSAMAMRWRCDYAKPKTFWRAKTPSPESNVAKFGKMAKAEPNGKTIA